VAEIPNPKSSARWVFTYLAVAGWAMWIAIASGHSSEHDSDSAAWLTCFTLWAPASYLLVLNRRSWARPGFAHSLLIASASIFATVELVLIGQSVKLFPSFLVPKAELPVWIGIPIFYGAFSSMAATPLLSLIVFVLGRRQPAPR
jgi:hypothetical protein